MLSPAARPVSPPASLQVARLPVPVTEVTKARRLTATAGAATTSATAASSEQTRVRRWWSMGVPSPSAAGNAESADLGSRRRRRPAAGVAGVVEAVPEEGDDVREAVEAGGLIAGPVGLDVGPPVREDMVRKADR